MGCLLTARQPTGLGLDEATSPTTMADWLNGEDVALKTLHPVPAKQNSTLMKNLRKLCADWYFKLDEEKSNTVCIDEHGANLWTQSARIRTRKEQPAQMSLPPQKYLKVTVTETISINLEEVLEMQSKEER